MTIKHFLPIFLLVSCLLFSLVLPVFADTQDKVVDDFDGLKGTAWTEGGVEPYLADDDTVNIIGTATANALEGYFTFEDTTFTTVTAVTAYFRTKSTTLDDYVIVYNGTDNVQGNLYGSESTSYTTESFAISWMDTPSEVNAFKVYFKYIKVGSATTFYITQAYLHITGTIEEVVTEKFSFPDTTKTTISLTWRKWQYFSPTDTTKTSLALAWNLIHGFSWTEATKTAATLAWNMIHIFAPTDTTKTSTSLSWNLWHTFSLTDLTKTVAAFTLKGVTRTLKFSFEITAKMLETFSKSWVKTLNFADTSKTLESFGWNLWHRFAFPIRSITSYSFPFTPPTPEAVPGYSLAWVFIFVMTALMMAFLFMMAYTRRR